MNKTNNSAFKLACESNEQIQAAVVGLVALGQEVKAHTKRRKDRVPHNVAWIEKATHIDF